MKKNLILLAILVVLVAIVVGILINLNLNKEYTLDEVVDLIDVKITDNMSFKSETYLDEKYKIDTLMDGRTEIYLKDDKMSVKYYSAAENQEGINNLLQEFFLDFESETQINITHYSKEILNTEISPAFTNLIAEEIESYKGNLSMGQSSYQYCGKENGIIKVSIAASDTSKQYYYINEKEKTLEKLETYIIEEDGEYLYSTTILTYSYDTVKSEDIAFEEIKYSDYTVSEQEIFN